MKIHAILPFLKPAAHPNPIQDPKIIDQTYRYWRIRIFYSMYVGYALFYFTRKSFTFAMPALIEDLHFTKFDLGFLSTILYITYGISKFASGVLSDQSNPRYFMACGLILTGILNIFFGASSSLWWFALFWGLNGWFQGWGWPPITKQLTHWYGQKERGAWWSVCSTSHNLGGAIIPILAAYCATHCGWRYAMHIPGVVCILYGLILLNRLRDVPQSLGLPPIEHYKDEIIPASNKQEKASSLSEPLSAKQILFEQVLNNKYVWMLAISYFFVYVVRTAINDWTVLYLVETKGYQETVAGVSVALFELGGFLGMLAAGWGSDYFFEGRRVPFMIFCSVGLMAAVALFWWTPPGYQVVDFTLMSLIGFLVFGPQMLVGLAAAELVSKKAACTANGFAGCWAYAGAAVTGFPLGYLIDQSWNAYYAVLVACSVMTLVVLWPLKDVKGPSVVESKAKSKLEEDGSESDLAAV